MNLLCSNICHEQDISFLYQLNSSIPILHSYIHSHLKREKMRKGTGTREKKEKKRQLNRFELELFDLSSFFPFSFPFLHLKRVVSCFLFSLSLSVSIFDQQSNNYLSKTTEHIFFFFLVSFSSPVSYQHNQFHRPSLRIHLNNKKKNQYD